LDLPDSELQSHANRARWWSLLYAKRWVLYAKLNFDRLKDREPALIKD
jgi:hypothetical protein